MVAIGTSIQPLTFKEVEYSPVQLPDEKRDLNAFEYFDELLQGCVYDFFYLMFENAVDCYDDDISQSLKSTTSTNPEYIQKLIQLNQ